MKIVVAARCYNNVEYVERFLRGYDFADEIVISDGGSTDGSVELLEDAEFLDGRVNLIRFTETETINGHTWNPDAPHMNFVLDAAKSLDPDWLIFDDFDCVPNINLRSDARDIFEFAFSSDVIQVNAFRIYLWGKYEYFPQMNNGFDSNYKSIWAWQPKRVNIYADPNVKHGTLVGLTTNWGLEIPYCLLHKSWHPDTIQAKMDKYNAIGLPMNHPLSFAGKPEELPLWARE